MDKENFSFEKAFIRLEEILELMNSDKVTLDESLKLFEEADVLINNCSQTLKGAEKKVQMLIKNRNQLMLDSNQNPQMQDFAPSEKSSVNGD